MNGWMDEAEAVGWHRTGLGPLQAHQRDPRTPSSDGRGGACTLSRWDRAPRHLLFLRLPAPSTRAGPVDPMGRLLAQSRCSENVPRPPFPPGTELGQAPADAAPSNPLRVPAWRLPNRTLGRARCPSPPPPPMAICSHHQLLQREPPWLWPRGAAAFLGGDGGPQPPCPAPALTGCSPAASQFPEPA